ncbi:MAG: hypothetical protein U1G07_10765 [Verrucomicrobiota bacterium]
MPPRFSEDAGGGARLWQQAAPRTIRRRRAAAARDVKTLWAGLEQLLGARDEWRLPVLRELWSALFAGASRRRHSPDHERIYFQLLGFALRPGFGYALDEWRSEQTVQLFAEGSKRSRTSRSGLVLDPLASLGRRTERNPP